LVTNLGLSIYSLIHQVLENVGSFVAFAQTPLFLFIFSSAYSPISFNLFLLFIYYSTAVTIILFSLYLTRGEPFSIASFLVVVAFIFCFFSNLLYTPCLSFPRPGGSCSTKRNTPCRNTLLNIFRRCTCIPPAHHVFFCLILYWDVL